MDLEGRPEGRRVRINEDTSRHAGIHHDPLNEQYEETWSVLGDQDERSTGSDPGMLPPPMPALPATLGTILGRPRTSMQLEDSAGSLYHAPANMRKGEEKKSPWGRIEVRKGSLAPTETDERHSAGGYNFRHDNETSSEGEEGSSTTRGESLGSANEEETNSNEESDRKKSEELDRFFKTMYKKTKRMPLLKQIGVRREIRELVLNAEKEEQAAARKKKQKSSKGSMR